jgi:Kazal-type serine protease inhibitor domain
MFSLRVTGILSALALAFAALMLAPANEASAQRGCTREYRPVCGLQFSGERKTFPNACVARNARAKILHDGECGRGAFCTFHYDPVCARDPRGFRRTYGNLCMAEKDNAVVLRKGRC